MTDKYSKEELEKLPKLAKTMASNVVFDLLESTIMQYVEHSRDKEKDLATAKQLCAEIETFRTNEPTGSLDVPFEQLQITLRMQLAIVPKNHQMEIDLPIQQSDAPQIYNMLGFLVKTATIYYKSFAVEHPELITKISNLVSKVDLSIMQLDKLNMTLYFWKAAKLRIGLTCFYVDAHEVRIPDSEIKKLH